MTKDLKDNEESTRITKRKRTKRSHESEGIGRNEEITWNT